MLWNFIVLVLLELAAEACGEYCRGFGHYCEEPQRCCGATCCYPRNYSDAYHTFRWSVWNMWYFWFMVIFVLMSCFGGCGYWRRRQLMLSSSSSEPSTFTPWYGFGFGGRQRRINGYGPSVTTAPINAPVLPITSYEHPSYPASRPPAPTTSGGLPQGAFPSPPPYAEVANKPGIYPPSKDELPPYPGEPYQPPSTEDRNEVPGVPAYSPPAYSLRSSTSRATGNSSAGPETNT